jgi:hypothetical protein
MNGMVAPIYVVRRKSGHNNTLHTEPRAARVLQILIASHGPVMLIVELNRFARRESSLEAVGKKRSESVCAGRPGRLDIPGCSVFPGQWRCPCCESRPSRRHVLAR